MIPSRGEMLLWFLLSFGITLVITQSSLFRKPREWDMTGLLSCPMCTGWWVGFGLTWLSLGPAPEAYPWLLRAVANAFCSAGVCWVVHVVLMHLRADKL